MDNYEYYHESDDRTKLNDKSIYMKDLEKMRPNRPNRNLGNEPCRVCGFSKTTGRNFGVITCSTCKAFFRRNGRTATALPPCRFSGNCSVNERTRRQCPSCRLAKCFAVGMQKDLIRTEEERAARLQLVKANRLQRSEKVLQKSSHQQTSDIHESYHLTNKSKPLALMTNEWIQLSNIRSAYEHFCLYPILRSEEDREEFLSTQPIKCRLKEHSFITALKTRLSSLTAFFRATIPAFSVDMNSNDRQWLVCTNLRYLLLFSSMDLMNISGNQLHFDEHRACHTAYLYVYGEDLLHREEYLINKLSDFIGLDPIISKVMQIILFLAPCLVTNYPSVTQSYQPASRTISQISHSQGHYTHILWLYLVHRHGEIEAAKLFMLLIGQVLQHQTYGVDVDKRLIEKQPFGNMVYSLLTTFSMN